VRNTLPTIFLVAVGLLAVSVPLFAHHGNAAFDTGSKVTVKGTVTEWYWANPHCFLKFDVTDDKGSVVHWVAETSNPADMVNRGWAKQSLKPGEEVTVTMQVVKGGNPIGRVQQIVLANGRVLGTQLPQEPKPTDNVATP
jgi:predicted extracellular nuclease